MNAVVVTRSSPAARPRLCLFGAPGSNTNLGLNALMHGTLTALLRHEPDADVTVFDNELGVRHDLVRLDDSTDASFTLVGARLSRRFTRPESYAAMRATLRLGGLGNPGARAVSRADAVLDVSGGDSFSDIYGEHRFRTVCAPKELALRANRPLVLLPQTYGPFRHPETAQRARALVLGAEQAWARDPDSFAVMQELLGPDLDHERHRLGVDLAMLLPTSSTVDLPAGVEAALTTGCAVGVNVSGLLWNTPESFGLAGDYRAAMTGIVRNLVRSGHPVVLLPHVLGRRPGGEADNLASDALLAGLDPRVVAEVHTVPWIHSAADAKHVIARCEFFVGTRMHSAIAALSSGTPCAAVAYSHKYHGIFSAMGVADAVLDARRLGTADLVDGVVDLLGRSATSRAVLGSTVPGVTASAHEQMRVVLGARRSRVSSAT